MSFLFSSSGFHEKRRSWLCKKEAVLQTRGGGGVAPTPPPNIFQRGDHPPPHEPEQVGVPPPPFRPGPAPATIVGKTCGTGTKRPGVRKNDPGRKEPGNKSLPQIALKNPGTHPASITVSTKVVSWVISIGSSPFSTARKMPDTSVSRSLFVTKWMNREMLDDER